MASEVPDPPELFDEPLVEEAPPVPPVVPEVVLDPVVVLPLEAVEDEVEEVDTGPVVPPLPELPLVADGEDVVLPLLVEPVDPGEPVAVVTDPPHDEE